MNLSELASWSTDRMHAWDGDKRTPLYDVIVARLWSMLALQAYLVRE
jgi:hypothetical protein